MADSKGQENYYLELSSNPIRFEPLDKNTNVFFDDAKGELFVVRSGGQMGIDVKGPREKDSSTVRIDSRGDVICIKFSPDRRILAVQRSSTSVEFINMKTGMVPDKLEYSQSCKGKSTVIIGFVWSSPNEVVFITDHGIEFYQITPEKRNLKCLKTINITASWFVWLAEASMLLLACGSQSNNLYLLQFKQGTITRFPKFEVDLPSSQKPIKLVEREVLLAVIYGQLYVVVLRQYVSVPKAEIVLYQVQREGPPRKTNVLQLDMCGRIAIGFVDNLVLVHHQVSKTSLIFDINNDGDSDNYVVHHYPVVNPMSIKPVTLLMSSNIEGTSSVEYTCPLYAQNWAMFPPNVVIDANLGSLWYLKLKLSAVVPMISDKVKLVKFLLCRKDGKSEILSVFRNMLMPNQQSSLITFSKVFDMVNKSYSEYLKLECRVLAGETKVDPSQHKQVVILQPDMYTHVFSIFEEKRDIKYKFIVAVLMEYLRSLNTYGIPAQHFIYEIVINTLVQNNCFYQLHQFLQYHVLNDSKPLACLMLSLDSFYPPAHQLALDMLKRLQSGDGEIIEVLLSKQLLLPSLRFVRSAGIVDTLSARKFLEAAFKTEDDMLFYTVYKFFENRNIRLRNDPKFSEGELCEQYTKHFENLFGADAFAVIPPT